MGHRSTVGVGVLLERSVTAFTLLKLAGALYLGYLGLRSLLGSQRSDSMTDEARPPAMRRADGITFFRQGVLGNLLNPKAGVIFVTIIPQFVRPGDPLARLLLMLLAFEVMLVIWLNCYGFVISRLGRSALGGTAAARRRARDRRGPDRTRSPAGVRARDQVNTDGADHAA